MGRVLLVEDEKLLRWDIPIPQSAQAYAERLIPDGVKALIISPCSSHVLRNWRAEYYAQAGDYAVGQLGLKVILCGGRSDLERRMGEEISRRMRNPCVNAIGKDTLLEFLATLERATVLLSPDSGPAHMATAVGTPVVGLYGPTPPGRNGPWQPRDRVVSAHDACACVFKRQCTAETWCLERVTVEEVVAALVTRLEDA